MDKLSTQTRISLICFYFESQKSPTLALRKHLHDNKLISHVCNESTLRRLVKRFLDTGSVLDTSRSGRPKISDEKIETVQQSLLEIQGTSQLGIASTRQVSLATGV